MRLEARSSLGAPFGAAAPVAGFAAVAATLRERADIGCLLVSAAVDSADIIAAAGAAAGVELPASAGAVKTGGGRLALWLSPRSWLVHCAPDEETALAQRLNAAFPDKIVHAAHFTDYLCWLELSGQDAEALLQEGGFLSLERDGLAVGHAKRTLIAGVTAVLVRQAQDAWLIGVERSRARYFASWLASCAQPGT